MARPYYSIVLEWWATFDCAADERQKWWRISNRRGLPFG